MDKDREGREPPWLGRKEMWEGVVCVIVTMRTT